MCLGSGAFGKVPMAQQQPPPPPPPGVALHPLLREQRLGGAQLELAALLDPATGHFEAQPACGYWRLSTRRRDGLAFSSWNVRGEPSRAANVVGSVPHGTVVGVHEETSDGWLRLAAGWVQREHDGAGWRKCSEQGHEPARLAAQRFAALCLAHDHRGSDVPAWVYWASDAPAGDAPFAPSGVLLFRMRRYVASRRLLLQPLLEAQPSAGCADSAPPKVIRTTFGQCPDARMNVRANGTEVICSHGGPCTVVSADVATTGVLAWIVENTGDNSCMLLGAVQDGFQANLMRAPDRPEWGVNSAHGHDQRFRVVKCAKHSKFIVIANLDAGKLSIYQSQAPRWGNAEANGHPENVLEAPAHGPIRLCVCLYNGGRFHLRPDSLPESIGISEAAAVPPRQSGASSPGDAATQPAAVAPLPVSAKLSLGAVYAVIRQAVRFDNTMCNVAIGAIQEMVEHMAPQSLHKDDDLQDWVLLLQVRL